MAVPVVVGSTGLHSSGTINPWLNLTSVTDGSWMIISVMALTTTTITPPSGWTAINAGQTSGTRRNYLYAKIKTPGDGTAATFTQSDTSQASYGLVWGTGGVDPTSWIIGTEWLRSSSAQPSGSRYDTIAYGLTTTDNDTLVLAISNEATNALVQSNEVTNVSPSGWTERLYLAQPSTNDRIETIWVGSKGIASPGTSGDVTITYVSPQDSDSLGMQIAIPSIPTPPPVPTIVGSSTNVYVNTASTFIISRPSGVVVGDYIIVVVRGQTGTATTDVSSAGFTRLGPAFVSSSATARLNGFYGRPVSDMTSEPTQYGFTFNSTGAARLIAVAFVVRGVDLTNPVLGFGSVYEGTSITNGRQVDPFAISNAPGLQLFMGGSEFAANNDHNPVTFPSGFTAITSFVSGSDTTVARTYVWVGQQEVAASPTGTASITWGVPANPAAESIVLGGTNTVPVIPAGSGITIARANGAAGKLYYIGPSGSANTPSAAVPMRRGFSDVTTALNTYGATWAHSGGSDSYPEMSLYGYTQSVMRGYGVLEISLGRTSDGVWFGLQDQTTNRTSGGIYGNASSQTWAQIQAQNIVIGAEGAPQPYMSWNELIATYGSTHIIVADPKYAIGTYNTEFLNMVASDVGTSRAIIKSSGAGSGSSVLATAAQAMGFQTWGFFYATDASVTQGGNGNLQAWGSYWNILGMEYGASQAIWNEALAFGKPVIGHIAPDQAAYNSAMSKGATAVQVSGVAVVSPVSWWNALPKSQNLIAQYGFNESSGATVADSSFKSNNLTVGTATGWVLAHSGSGLQSTSTSGSGAVNTSFTNPTAAITLMGWAYASTVTGEVPLFGFWSSPSSDPSGTNQFSIYASRSAFGPSNVLSANANISSTQTTATGAQMSINTWQHVAATFDGAALKLYLNGSLVSSTPQSGSLGTGSFVTTAKTDSIADDVRVFNTALNAAEITKWMNRSI